MKYLIKNITDKAGNTRTDIDYLKRIGSVAQFFQQPVTKSSLIFEYVKNDRQGNLLTEGITMTSPVKEIRKYNLKEFKGLIIYTENSIYYFTEMED